MKFALAIIPVFFALSAFGSPVELDTRQMPPQCNLPQCLSTIASQSAGIIPPCAAAATNLQNIQQAQSQGKPPSPADQAGLASNGLQCISSSIALGFAIPAACNGCPGAPA